MQNENFRTKAAQELLEMGEAAYQAGDLFLAFKDFADAAAWGSAAAMYRCGELSDDDVVALYWFAQAAALGHAEAQYQCGCIYQSGEDYVDADAAKAQAYYEQAAAQGHANAQYELGRLYAYGWGVPQDKEKARFWLAKALAEPGRCTLCYESERARLHSLGLL